MYNMNRILLLIAVGLTTLVWAQRPSYLGSGPVGYPGLASRFRDDDAESTTTDDLASRFGEGGTTPKIPVDARGDHDLVNRLNTWPREHRPFWVLNADHIEAQRNKAPNFEQRFGGGDEVDEFGRPLSIPARSDPSRSPFAGGRFRR